MIGSLRGVVLDRRPRASGGVEVTLEVGGVGYRVVMPTASASAIGSLGSGAFVHVHTHVREDAIVLFGFASADERDCFEALIAAHGVGPSVALALLSVHSPVALRRAVTSGDADALMLVPGIGRKTAARLLVELKERLGPGDGDLEPVAGPGQLSTRQDVRAALTALGYGADEVRQALSAVPDEGGTEVQVRLALKELAAAR